MSLKSKQKANALDLLLSPESMVLWSITSRMQSRVSHLVFQEGKILIYSICLFPLYTYSHHDPFQATSVTSLNTDLGRGVCD